MCTEMGRDIFPAEASEKGQDQGNLSSPGEVQAAFRHQVFLKAPRRMLVSLDLSGRKGHLDWSGRLLNVSAGPKDGHLYAHWGCPL